MQRDMCTNVHTVVYLNLFGNILNKYIQIDDKIFLGFLERK